jgi:hypothetical protein
MTIKKEPTTLKKPLILKSFCFFSKEKKTKKKNKTLLKISARNSNFHLGNNWCYGSGERQRRWNDSEAATLAKNDF